MARSGDSIRYGFAVGRVMVLRTRLLGRSAYERLLDAPTFADARRVLSETHFGRFVEHVETADDVERAVDASLLDLYSDFLQKASLPPAIVSYFRRPYDFSALKGALTSRLLDVVHEPPSTWLGEHAAEDFDEAAALPGALGEVARGILAADGPRTAEAIAVSVDRAMFAESARLAKASRVDLLVRVAAAEADVACAKVLLRAAATGKTPDAARRMLVPGGKWDADRAARLVRQPQALAEAIAQARVIPVPSPGDLLDIARLDVIADSAISRIAREAARMPVGPEPVLGYVLARRAEAVSVRSILVGRLTGLARDVISGRLREAAL